MASSAKAHVAHTVASRMICTGVPSAVASEYHQAPSPGMLKDDSYEYVVLPVAGGNMVKLTVPSVHVGAGAEVSFLVAPSRSAPVSGFLPASGSLSATVVELLPQAARRANAAIEVAME
jgi:hypothetical protein